MQLEEAGGQGETNIYDGGSIQLRVGGGAKKMLYMKSYQQQYCNSQ